MRGVVRKIDGVRDANVSLKDGIATIHFAPTNRVRVAQIWKAVRDNGFTPRSSRIRALGTVSVRGDTAIFTIGGSEDAFVLQDAASAPGRVAELRKLGPRVVVEISGELSDAPAKGRDTRVTLRVKSFALR